MRKHYKKTILLFLFTLFAVLFQRQMYLRQEEIYLQLRTILFEMCICTSQAFRRYWQD